MTFGMKGSDHHAPVITVGRPSEGILLAGLLSVAALLAVLHEVSVRSGLEVLESYFDLALEPTVPTWWSSFLLLFLGILLALLAHGQSDRDHRSARALYIGSAIALYFSLDEVATLHESVTGVFVRFEGIPRFPGDHGVWIFAYGILGLAILAYIVPGLISFAREERAASVKFLVGAGLFMLGGVGVEIVGYFQGKPVLLAETLEMVGTAVMVWATYGALQGRTIEFPSRSSSTTEPQSLR